MLLAKVVGHVVSTAKHPDHAGLKMLIVRPLAAGGGPAGPDLLAADAVGSGVGERVLVVVEGRSAGEAVDRPRAPLDAAIVGIVDRVDSS